jgi:hypothetical protein
VNAVAAYRAASEANDIHALVETLSPDVELVSPLAGRFVFRGREDLRVLLGAVYGTIAGLRWEEEIADGTKVVVIGGGSVGPLRVDDAMVFELAEDGRIRRIRPHLRPWLATTLFALKLAPKIALHPGLVGRAMRRA